MEKVKIEAKSRIAVELVLTSRRYLMIEKALDKSGDHRGNLFLDKSNGFLTKICSFFQITLSITTRHIHRQTHKTKPDSFVNLFSLINSIVLKRSTHEVK